MPSSCGMFVYSDVTSAVTKIAFSGRGGRDSRSYRKCLLSRMYEGSISTRGCMRWVTLFKSLSVGLPHADTVGRSAMLELCTLGRP